MHVPKMRTTHQSLDPENTIWVINEYVPFCCRVNPAVSELAVVVATRVAAGRVSLGQRFFFADPNPGQFFLKL